ncbi:MULTISPECIES: hypothetical protein [Streptomyces]|uniref:hypothetical protein n=1 Tax=Streptomyces TaxID=1883 RepID=UPI001E643704|nr:MULTISPECIES: hypothetical protein [Streptomyces]UFQ19618.1 hypothetical protein J2N69_34210 [Streptomyces huasconensis]WCL89236.1 hypothetical protein PPN52_34155 [Streptomyces sp. JCM 35825]
MAPGGAYAAGGGTTDRTPARIVMGKEEIELIRREREPAKAFQIPDLDLFV